MPNMPFLVLKFSPKIETLRCFLMFLKLINYSCSSHPTRAFYAEELDAFRNLMKNELKTTACLEIISNADANFLNLHIDKARKTHDDKQLYYTFYEKKLNKIYLLLTFNVTVQLLNSPKQKRPFFLNLNSRRVVATSSF